MKDHTSQLALNYKRIRVRLRYMKECGKFDQGDVLNGLNRIMDDYKNHDKVIIWMTVDTHVENPVITFGCNDPSENGPNYTTTYNYSW